MKSHQLHTLVTLTLVFSFFSEPASGQDGFKRKPPGNDVRFQNLAQRVNVLERRLDQMDQRLERIENVLFATIKFSEADARKQLDEARESLANSEKMHARGLVSAAQLELDRMSVDRAETLLKMCVQHEDHRMIGATLDLLDAKRDLEQKRLQLNFSRELLERGLIAREKIPRDQSAVLLAEKKLKLAEQRLRELKKVVAETPRKPVNMKTDPAKIEK